MLRTGMASRPWMRVPRKGRREAIGPRISEPLSSVQKSAKCLLHLHAYLVVVGSLPCLARHISLFESLERGGGGAWGKLGGWNERKFYLELF